MYCSSIIVCCLLLVSISGLVTRLIWTWRYFFLSLRLGILANFGRHFVVPRLPRLFTQMFPIELFICMEDPVWASDIFGGRIRHDVAMCLAVISQKYKK